MEEDFELIEGKLQLKKDAGGWRYYITVYSELNRPPVPFSAGHSFR